MHGDLSRYGFATRAIHAGQAPDPTTGSVAVPIYQTSTYVHDELGKHKGFEYSRVQNPTRFALEENVASLELGRSGHAFASGMAAIQALMTWTQSGDHIIVSRNVYGGTYRFFTQVLEKQGLSFSWVDTTSIAAIEGAWTPSTRMVFLETPTNPLMEVSDLAGVADLAHSKGAILAVDNTFLSPYLQQPIQHGADVVVHSTTKYLNGHSDSIGGVLVAATEDLEEWFYFIQKSAGAVMAPFDAFLVMRGIKTLAVRMRTHESSARSIADFLNQHSAVLTVLYPGLESHPGHDLQKRQARGFGGMISFDMGSLEAAKRVVDTVEVFSLAESLGGVESLISHPASMTHASVPEAKRKELGLSDGIVRISVGIEELDDLMVDLTRALE